MVGTLAGFEWRFNYRENLAAMIPDLARAAARATPAPDWYLKTAAYGAQSGSRMNRPAAAGSFAGFLKLGSPSPGRFRFLDRGVQRGLLCPR